MASKTKKLANSASGCGCITFFVLACGWLILTFIGPLDFLENSDYYSNSTNTKVSGTMTMGSIDVSTGSSIYVVNITPASGTAVQAGLSQPVYQYIQPYCASGQCYADAEFEYNDGLYRMTVYDRQGGNKLLDINNHSQRTDDVASAIVLNSIWGVLTVILAIWMVFYFKSSPKKTVTKTSSASASSYSSNSAMASIPPSQWQKGFPPQGGINPDGVWYVPPPSASQVMANLKPGQSQPQGGGSSWPASK